VPDLRSATQDLKGQLGLAPDVNISAASSAPIVANPNTPIASPSQQEANTAAVLANIAAPPAKPAIEEVVDKKEKAIVDQREQIANLQSVVTSQTEKMEQILGALSKSKETPTQPEVQLPQIPADISDRSADEQVSILTGAYNDLQKTVAETFKNERENLLGFLAPFASEMQQVVKIKDKTQVLERFPNYDWEANLPAFEKRRATTGLGAIEVARLVADPNQLVDPEPVAPATEAVVPSIEATSGRPTSQQQDDSADMIQRYNAAIVDQHRQGSRVTANQIVDASLKRRLFNK